jgi:hypothetical protein
MEVRKNQGAVCLVILEHLALIKDSMMMTSSEEEEVSEVLEVVLEILEVSEEAPLLHHLALLEEVVVSLKASVLQLLLSNYFSISFFFIYIF